MSPSGHLAQLSDALGQVQLMLPAVERLLGDAEQTSRLAFRAGLAEGVEHELFDGAAAV